MALEYKIFDEGLTVIALISGCVTADELNDYTFWLITNHNKQLKSGLRHLILTRDIQKIQFTEQDLHRFAQINLTYGLGRGKVHTAIVSQDSAIKKLASLHKTVSHVANIEVNQFNILGEALDWLGIDAPETRAYAEKIIA